MTYRWRPCTNHSIGLLRLSLCVSWLLACAGRDRPSGESLLGRWRGATYTCRDSNWTAPALSATKTPNKVNRHIWEFYKDGSWTWTDETTGYVERGRFTLSGDKLVTDQLEPPVRSGQSVRVTLRIAILADKLTTVNPFEGEQCKSLEQTYLREPR